LLEKQLANLTESFTDAVASGSAKEQKIYQQLMELYVIHVLRPLDQVKLGQEIVDFSLLDAETKEVYKSILSHQPDLHQPKPVRPTSADPTTLVEKALKDVPTQIQSQETDEDLTIAVPTPASLGDIRKPAAMEKSTDVVALFSNAYNQVRQLPPALYIFFILLVFASRNRGLLRRLLLKAWATARLGMTVR
jgi:hypothetical protein